MNVKEVKKRRLNGGSNSTITTHDEKLCRDEMSARASRARRTHSSISLLYRSPALGEVSISNCTPSNTLRLSDISDEHPSFTEPVSVFAFLFFELNE